LKPASVLRSVADTLSISAFSIAAAAPTSMASAAAAAASASAKKRAWISHGRVCH
jgi:hypothetical protein